MAYTPTVWETGDIITAEKLNKAEQGIADASPVVLTGEWEEHQGTYGIDFCTVEEFNNMVLSGKNILFSFPELENILPAFVLRFKDFNAPNITYFGTVPTEDPTAFSLFIPDGISVIGAFRANPT